MGGRPPPKVKYFSFYPPHPPLKGEGMTRLCHQIHWLWRRIECNCGGAWGCLHLGIQGQGRLQGGAASFLTSNAVQDVATLNWFLACRGTGHGGSGMWTGGVAWKERSNWSEPNWLVRVQELVVGFWVASSGRFQEVWCIPFYQNHWYFIISTVAVPRNMNWPRDSKLRCKARAWIPSLLWKDMKGIWI